MTIFTVNSNSETLRQISDMLLDLYPDARQKSFQSSLQALAAAREETWPSWMSCFPR